MVWFLLLFLAAPTLSAHEDSPAVLALRELEPGRFAVRFSPPVPPIGQMTLGFPASCTLGASPVFVPKSTVPTMAADVLQCAPTDRAEEIVFTSDSASAGRVHVHVERLDGTESFAFSSGAPPRVRVQLSHASSDGAGSILRQYVLLGVEHIAFGIDHLLFLLGLLLLVRNWRTLLATVSAFTVAHSITLVMASLGLLRVPAAPVEICIALSVLLLALESSDRGPTLTRQAPWLVAFGFGLLHGLGFASALAEVGLPAGAVPLSLLSFNVGVELGQLIAIALVLALYRVLQPWPDIRIRLDSAAAWLLGGTSVYWVLNRTHGWLGELLT